MGAVVTEHTYDAWGNVLTTTGSLASTVGRYNPFRYRSYYYDSETGFYYLQSRYYDPTVGRFLNADGIVGANGGAQGYNLFAYCNNNPIACVDYSGYLCTYNTAMTDSGRVPEYMKVIAEFLLFSIQQGVRLYHSHEAVAQAWANENRALSENNERVALIYEAYGYYYLSSTCEGMRNNVIFDSVNLIRFDEHYDPLVFGRPVAYIHSHPNPYKDFINDYPSNVDMALFYYLSNYCGYNELYVVPYAPKGSAPIILASDASTWNQQIKYNPEYAQYFE